MTASATLTVALILALTSNAVLLLILLFQSTGQYFAGEKPLHQPSYSPMCGGCKLERSDTQLSDTEIRTNLGSVENRVEEQPKFIFRNKNMEQEDMDNVQPEGLGYFLKHPELCKSQMCGVLLRMYRDYLRSSQNSGDSSAFKTPTFTSLPSDQIMFKHLWPKDYNNGQRFSHYLLQRALEKERSTSTESNSMLSKNKLDVTKFSVADSHISPFIRPGNDTSRSLSKTTNTAKGDEYYKDLEDATQNRNFYQGDRVPQSETLARPGRLKRDAPSPATSQEHLDGRSSETQARYHLEEVFSTFTENELEKFGPPVSEILMPALISFEVMVLSEVEALSAGLVGHDLRLEKLEKAKLNWEERGDEEPQADAQDNKTSLDEEAQVIAEDGILLGNLSGGLELLEEMGSGDGEVKLFPSSTTTTTTTVPTTTAASVHYNYNEDIYRSLSTVEQKMQNLENFNLMSDTILQEARLEVIKMDDKVTELDRKNRNLNVRTSMQTYRIGQLETFMGKSEVMLQTMMGSVSRQASKVDYIKDSLSEFKKELHAVTVEFGRQNQIASELRAADSYKAHDINEIRQSVLALESRLNSLYRVLDQSADTVRMDVRTSLDRICATNGLSC